MSALNLFSLENRNIVITGALGQLGQRFSVTLCEAGANVAAVDLNTKPQASTAEFTEWVEKERIRIFQADVTNRSSLENCLQQINDKMGSISGLINNAAIDSPPGAPASENGPFETYPEESLQKMLDVNLKGVVLCSQVFGGTMAANGGGSIVNISSIYGMLSPVQDIYEYKRRAGEDWYKPVGYSVTKSGLMNLTRYTATYWAKKGVRVNTLTPAGIFNNQDQNFLDSYLPRVPMGRMARADELNGAVIFLLSNASSYMTGSNLVIDGGWTAW